MMLAYFVLPEQFYKGGLILTIFIVKYNVVASHLLNDSFNLDKRKQAKCIIITFDFMLSLLMVYLYRAAVQVLEV